MWKTAGSLRSLDLEKDVKDKVTDASVYIYSKKYTKKTLAMK